MNGDIAQNLFEQWIENNIPENVELTIEEERILYSFYEDEILQSGNMDDYINDQIGDR